jgi:RNA polymerase sigma-70 factor (ECF subfamily)
MKNVRSLVSRSPAPGQDTERFVRLFVAGQREVLRYILAFVPNLDDAHEILQETALDLWKKFDRYDPAYPFAPWACRFAFLQVLKFRERKSRQGKYLSLESLTQLAADRSEKDETLENRRRALAACLQRLNDAERLMVEQRYSRQMPVAEISALTGRNVSTLYKALERVRRRLFDCVSRRLELGSYP